MSSRNVANFITAATFDRLPPEVVTQAKVAIRDHLGALLAARGDRAVAAASRVAMAMGGREEATLLDAGIKVPCNLAAMVNTTMTSTLDMDDGAYRPIGHLVHAGRVVVPTSLAVAERRNASGKDLIEAVVIAYEVTLRAGWLIRLWGTVAPAGMAGNYGAAAATAKLLGLSTEETVHALGIAEAHCLYPSRAEFLKKKTMTKDSAGWGAMTGVTAALLAQAGFEGPDTIFDLPEYNQEPLETLGREWEILRLYFKPHSSCRFTHAPVDGVFELMKKYRIGAGDLAKVTVGVASGAMIMVDYRPATTWEAQFSIPFAIGAALADGEVGPGQIAESRLGDETILSQADKVEVVASPEVDALRPGMVPARVKITTTDGREFETWVPHPRGAPENPLSEEELSGKFRKLATRAIGADRTEDLSQCLDGLEDLADINQLVETLRPNKDELGKGS